MFKQFYYFFNSDMLSQNVIFQKSTKWRKKIDRKCIKSNKASYKIGQISSKKLVFRYFVSNREMQSIEIASAIKFRLQKLYICHYNSIYSVKVKFQGQAVKSDFLRSHGMKFIFKVKKRMDIVKEIGVPTTLKFFFSRGHPFSRNMRSKVKRSF